MHPHVSNVSGTTHTTGFIEVLFGFGATAGFTHVRELGLEAAAAAGVLGAQEREEVFH